MPRRELVSDLVPYEGRDLPALPDSPSGKWRIVKAEPVHVAGRSHRNNKRMLQLILEHEQPDGNFVTIEALVDEMWKLPQLLPLLEWAENMPDGMRIKGYVREKVPWARDPNRRYQYGG